MPLYSLLGIFLVLLSLFHGCSKVEKEEHAGSHISLPPESFRIVSVEPEDAAEQVTIQTSLKVVFKLRNRPGNRLSRIHPPPPKHHLHPGKS